MGSRIFVWNETSSDHFKEAIQCGTTIREYLEDSGITPNKVDVLVNGSLVSDLDDELENDDRITTATKKYSSGGNGLGTTLCC